MNEGFWYVAGAVLIPGLLLASWIDYAQRRVPNWLNLALLLSGLTAQGVFFGRSGVYDGLLGALTGLGLLLLPWLMHGMGAGDVKLLAAIGAWLGPRWTFYSFAAGAILGGVVAVIMIVSSGRLRMACANLGVILTKCTHRQMLFSEFGSARSFGATSQLLPYGVPLSAGTILVLALRWFGVGGG